MLDSNPYRLESAFAQRDPTNSFYEEINISGSDIIIYHDSTGTLTADKVSVWASKYGIATSGSFSISSSYARTASYALNGGGTSLTTGSTYPITSSWALSASTYPFQGDITTLSKPNGINGYSTGKQTAFISGSPYTILNINGHSGYVSDIWMALDTSGDDGSILTIIIDGVTVYNNRYDQFFASLYFRGTWGPSFFDNLYLQNRGGQGSFIPIPFSSSIQISYTPVSNCNAWWCISYHTEVPNTWPYSKNFRTAVNNGVALTVNQTASLIDISSQPRGKLLGIYLFIDSYAQGASPTTAPLEGRLRIYTDGAQSYESSGTEDYFRMAGYFGFVSGSANASPYISLSCKNIDRWGGVRFHIPDEYKFNNALKITWTAGESSVSFTGHVVLSWVVYYYTE